MTPKQERFVAEYLVDLNATQAAIRAGYPARSAGSVGFENLKKPEIAAAISGRQAVQLRVVNLESPTMPSDLHVVKVAKAELTAARTLEEMRRLAFSDPRQFFDEHGNLKQIHQLSDEEAACIASVEVVIKNAAAGDGHTDTIYKIKLWDKPRVMEMVAKHFRLISDHVEVTGSVELLARLDTWKQRQLVGD